MWQKQRQIKRLDRGAHNMWSERSRRGRSTKKRNEKWRKKKGGKNDRPTQFAYSNIYRTACILHYTQHTHTQIPKYAV